MVKEFVTVREHKKPEAVNLERLCKHLVPREEPSKFFGSGSASAEKIVIERDSVTQDYCELTNQLCVGSLKEQVRYQKLLNPEVVLRCPSLRGYD